MIVPGLAMPVINQIFLDEVLTNKHPDWATNIYLALIGAIVINCLMNYLRSYILTTWQKKLTLADSSSFFWHLIRLPIQFFQQRYSAEVASRITFNESVAGVLSNRKLTDLTMRLQQDKGKEYGTLMNGLLMIESVKANGGEADFLQNGRAIAQKLSSPRRQFNFLISM